MSAVYISIEKNIDGFDMFRALWNKLGVDGIRADTMTEGIEKAIEIERSKIGEIYFIDIVAEDIDYMPQLKYLREETTAPILIATSDYNDDEHHEALNNGADFYGGYCETPEQNINAVIASINSIERRAKMKKTPSKVIVYGGIIISPLYRNEIFVNEKKVELFKIEFDILYFLMEYRGKTLPYERIYKDVWRGEYDEAAKNAVWAAVGRLRDNLKKAAGGTDYIETVRDVGYRFRLISDK
jgi:two-component system alkaline phosphatase synthesis response regulator PhoP